MPSSVKLFDPFPRRRGTTLGAFSDHWSTVHAGIARRLPPIRHYVQSHRIEDTPAALGAPRRQPWADGSSETWYDNRTSAA